MQLQFEFETSHTRDDARRWFEVMASTLTGRRVTFQRTEHQVGRDANGMGRCFSAKWVDGELTFDERVETNDAGNPRDGWGYDSSLVLTGAALTLRSSGEHDSIRSFGVTFEGPVAHWLALRATLRQELGAKADRSHLPYYVYELLPALVAAGEREAALALARESLAGSPPSMLRREEIVAWLAENDPTAGGPQMRVREAPGVLDGWLVLERAGGKELTETFARLCPYELDRWRAAGLPPAAWFAHPAWPRTRNESAAGDWLTIHLTADYVGPSFINRLSAALTGWQPSTDWQEVGEDWMDAANGWRWRTSRYARVPDGGTLPVVHAILSGVRREPDEWSLDWEQLMSRNFRETLTWTWIGGPATGDAVVLVERALPRRANGSPEPSGVALSVVGTTAFRERALAAVRAQSQLRWYPVSASESLKPWPASTPFPDVLTALEALVTPERVVGAKELLACRCPPPGVGYCTHRNELLGYARENSLLGDALEQARLAAWNAALSATGQHPRPEMVQQYLAQAAELHRRAAELIEG